MLEFSELLPRAGDDPGRPLLPHDLKVVGERKLGAYNSQPRLGACQDLLHVDGKMNIEPHAPQLASEENALLTIGVREEHLPCSGAWLRSCAQGQQAQKSQ